MQGGDDDDDTSEEIGEEEGAENDDEDGDGADDAAKVDAAGASRISCEWTHTKPTSKKGDARA